jgi:hypothetical protein
MATGKWRACILFGKAIIALIISLFCRFVNGGTFKLIVDGQVEYETDGAFDYGYSNMIGTCTVACVDLSLDLYTDYWAPDDNSMTLNIFETGEDVWSQPSFERDSFYHYEACINPDGCATLEIVDTWGDG